ncbi:class I SAM-dependent methyltransferase [Patiriisocius sp. Uisw_017]|uniref:class I SAM-dependent methyltransferase n=1 Tax=Patiriisocius sp. Uisw_017 TaxID=3230968 RepID=UPI0039E875B3
MKCKVCGNSKQNKSYMIREMMIGLREEFEYILCSSCGCLQISEVPKNMLKYYGKDYYSFSMKTNFKHNKIKDYLTKQRDLYIVENQSNYLGQIINYMKPASSFVKILSHLNITKNSRILDVGTGIGVRMEPLVNMGYNVLGIDPYLEKDVINVNGLEILRKDIYEVEGQFDLIMLNHVFEHLEDPAKILSKINDLLSPNGKCLIRIPIIPSFAWEKYQENWIQIDAPRHFFIHSNSSLELLSRKAKLKIEKIIYDSIPFQFIGSELYKRDISMKEGDFRLNKENTLFSVTELDEFIKKTKELNSSKNGDQAAFILTKMS